jgi:ubiquinone/menaquinone biosynthesis C-methylase UbiE
MSLRPRRLAPLLALALIAPLGCHGDRVDLDDEGRAMLNPRRADALHPPELIAALHLRPADTVADVGAGPGFLTLPLAAAVPAGRVIATDVNAKYLTALARRARRAGIGNIETRVVTSEQTGLEDRAVDLVVLCQVDHYLADRTRYLAALARALRPGGRIAVVNFRRYREEDVAAARAASLELQQIWEPSSIMFAALFAPSDRR